MATGQPHGEDGALPLAGAGGLDRAAVQLDQVPDQRQARGRGRCARRVDVLSACWNRSNTWGSTSGGDALAGVADDDLDVRVHPLQVHLDAPAPRRELHGVDQQVPDDLLEAVGIAGDPGRPRIEHRLQPEALGLGGRPHGVERRLHDGLQVDRPHVEPHLAGHDARDVQHVVDELHLRVGVAHDDVERPRGRLALRPRPDRSMRAQP